LCVCVFVCLCVCVYICKLLFMTSHEGDEVSANCDSASMIDDPPVQLPFLQPQSQIMKIPEKFRKPYTISKPREIWSKEEHEKFILALKMYGRDWKKITSFIGSKQVTQIRSHAQKYFFKAKDKGEHIPPPRPKKKSLTPYPHKIPNSTVKSQVSRSSIPHPPTHSISLTPITDSVKNVNITKIESFLEGLFVPESKNHLDALNEMTEEERCILQDCMARLAQSVLGAKGDASISESNANWIMNNSFHLLELQSKKMMASSSSVSTPSSSSSEEKNLDMTCSVNSQASINSSKSQSVPSLNDLATKSFNSLENLSNLSSTLLDNTSSSSLTSSSPACINSNCISH